MAFMFKNNFQLFIYISIYLFFHILIVNFSCLFMFQLWISAVCLQLNCEFQLFVYIQTFTLQMPSSGKFRLYWNQNWSSLIVSRPRFKSGQVYLRSMPTWPKPSIPSRMVTAMSGQVLNSLFSEFWFASFYRITVPLLKLSSLKVANKSMNLPKKTP